MAHSISHSLLQEPALHTPPTVNLVSIHLLTRSSYSALHCFPSQVYESISEYQKVPSNASLPRRRILMSGLDGYIASIESTVK